MRSGGSEVGIPSEDPGRVPGMVIETDRACPKCGYNVRGITVGQPCPECGRPVFFGLQASPEFVLADTPYVYIRIVQAALWGLFLGAFGAGLALALRGIIGDAITPALGAASLVWVASLGVLCLPRPHDREEHSPMDQIPLWKRFGAAGSQSLWVISVSMLMLFGQQPWALEVIPWVIVAAAAGLIPTMLFLADVADFAGDPDRGKRLMQIAVTLLIALSLAGLGIQLRVGVPLPSVSAIVTGIALVPIIIMVAGLISLWHLFQLAAVGSWAIHVAQREDERTANLRERFNQDRQLGSTDHEAVPFGGPVQAPINSMMGMKSSRRD